jgi:hypothetical protein
VNAFESAAWFKDKFGILGKKDQGKKHAPPKELFNLDVKKYTRYYVPESVTL